MVGGNERRQGRCVAERDEYHVDLDVAGSRLHEQVEMVTQRAHRGSVELATDLEPGDRSGVGGEQSQARRTGQTCRLHVSELMWSPCLFKVAVTIDTSETLLGRDLAACGEICAQFGRRILDDREGDDKRRSLCVKDPSRSWLSPHGGGSVIGDGSEPCRIDDRHDRSDGRCRWSASPPRWASAALMATAALDLRYDQRRPRADDRRRGRRRARRPGRRRSSPRSAAVVSFDFFHTEPYLSLAIDSRDDIETTVLLLIAGVFVGTIASSGRIGTAPRGIGAGRDPPHPPRRRGGGLRAPMRPMSIAAAQDELRELLTLRECRFEALPAPTTAVLPRIGRNGAIEGVDRRCATAAATTVAVASSCRRTASSCPVLARGQHIGRFVLVPTPGVAVVARTAPRRRGHRRPGRRRLDPIIPQHQGALNDERRRRHRRHHCLLRPLRPRTSAGATTSSDRTREHEDVTP